MEEQQAAVATDMKWRMTRKKYKKIKRKEQLWIKSFSQTTA